MGQGNSLPFDEVDGFTAEEVVRLEKRFRKLDLDGSRTLSVGEFLSVPELKENPLVNRVVSVFDADNSGEVDFKEFVKGLAMFAVKTEGLDQKQKKLRFMFNIYDIDNDGYISNGELFQVLEMMVGTNLKDTQLQQIVDKTILQLDKDEDGKISYEEFCAIVAPTKEAEDDVTNALTLDIPKI